MEDREARRAAERTARERLAGSLIGAVGGLGVTAAQQHTAAAGVSAKAREHLRRSEHEAAGMVAGADERVAAANQDYHQAHQAALVARWSAAALADMGYATPNAAARQRKRSHPAAAAHDHRQPGEAAPAQRMGRIGREEEPFVVIPDDPAHLAPEVAPAVEPQPEPAPASP